MKTVLIILGYLKWHYGKAIIALSLIWNNFLYFIFNFFSIKLLWQNLFTPWKKMSDPYNHKFNLKDNFYTFISNSIMRIVGLLMRSALIMLGLLTDLLLIGLYPFIIILWLILPILICLMIAQSLRLIFF
jgi:hypothetical protein